MDFLNHKSHLGNLWSTEIKEDIFNPNIGLMGIYTIKPILGSECGGGFLWYALLGIYTNSAYQLWPLS